MAYSIFVAHPSALLTDVKPHGDGLAAYGFLRSLAERGHRIEVAAQDVEVDGEWPATVRVHRLARVRGPEPLARLDYMRQMRGLFLRLRQTTQFDLIHQLNPVDAGLSLAVADAGLPLVLGPYVPAWPSVDGASRRLMHELTRGANRAIRVAQESRATAVLLTTPAAAQKLGRRPTPRLLVREVPHGVDDRFRADLSQPSTQDVLFLANLERRKGIFVLLDAFARVAARLPDARLRIAGAGSQSDAVARAVHGLGLAHRAEVVGPVPRHHVVEVMQACAVFCLPSFGEPFGMTALEAMACGKPLVVTDAGGLRYLVDDRGGRRVAPGDPAALAAALLELLGQPELRRQMGAHNVATVEATYRWPRVTARLEEVYGEAIAAFARSGP